VLLKVDMHDFYKAAAAFSVSTAKIPAVITAVMIGPIPNFLLQVDSGL